MFFKQLFNNKVLCASFLCLQFGFVIFWRKDFGAKAAHKSLVKLTPGEFHTLHFCKAIVDVLTRGRNNNYHLAAYIGLTQCP
jgi:hypothetical protein